MESTVSKERLDIDRLHQEISESAKQASGIRFPCERTTARTIELIQSNWEAFHEAPPREGEWATINEEHRRIAEIWDRHKDGVTEFQPAKSGSVYLYKGHGSFSGSLDSIVTMKLTHVGWRLAPFWIFYGGYADAGNGVRFTIPTRVFAEV